MMVFVRTVSGDVLVFGFGNAFWLWKCYGYREGISVVGVRLSFGSMHPPGEL